MENLFKKNLRFGIAGLILIFIILGVRVYQINKELKIQRQRARYLMDSFNPNTEAGKEAFKIHEEYEHMRKGDKHLEKGEYDLAIEEYKKAEEMVGGDNKWVSKWELAEAYEKSGQYDLALKEIDWLISRGPREEVLKELTEWKSRLQNLGKAQGK